MMPYKTCKVNLYENAVEQDFKNKKCLFKSTGSLEAYVYCETVQDDSIFL